MAAKKSSKEPRTMAELLASAKTPIRSFSVGEKVSGRVLGKSRNSLILDIGGKSEGVVAERSFSEARSLIDTLEVGDEIQASVLVPETKEGVVLLTLRDAVFETAWKKLSDAKAKADAIPVLGKGVNPSGVNVEVEGQAGFIPQSQLGALASKNPQALIGKYFKAKVVEVDRLNNKIVLSEREVSEANDIKAVKVAISKVKEGKIYDGEVTTVASFGCFVKINLGSAKKPVNVEGLVHISELSWGRAQNASDIVKEGDKVKVKVIGVKNGKLALSIKQAGLDPWEEAEAKYKPETKIKGKVSRVTDFGIFVEVEPGVEGLIHITKIPPAMKYGVGQEVNCVVEEIDTKSKKLSLGLVLTEKPIGYK
ncbi:30S ribosomal protein S1 [Candidatus Curtissbacteria bacterium]|nr:30S ribosomal protein S1 [Candidatus Curtissbacteria bacterium]